MDVHTRTVATHRRQICNHVLEGNKLIKRFKLEQKVKKNHKRYSSWHLLKETMKKLSTLASNTSSFYDGCLCLTWFIVTKLILIAFITITTKIPRGVLSYLPYRYWSEIRSRVRIWRAGKHIPHPGYPSDLSVNNMIAFIVWTKNPGGVIPYICLIGIGLK